MKWNAYLVVGHVVGKIGHHHLGLGRGTILRRSTLPGGTATTPLSTVLFFTGNVGQRLFALFIFGLPLLGLSLLDFSLLCSFLYVWQTKG